MLIEANALTTTPRHHPSASDSFELYSTIA